MYPYAILFGGAMAVYANGGSVIFIEGTDDLNTVKDIATFAATMGHDGDLGIQANGYVELVGSAEVEIGISSSDSEIDTDGTSIVIKNVNNSNEYIVIRTTDTDLLYFEYTQNEITSQIIDPIDISGLSFFHVMLSTKNSYVSLAIQDFPSFLEVYTSNSYPIFNPTQSSLIFNNNYINSGINIFNTNVSQAKHYMSYKIFSNPNNYVLRFELVLNNMDLDQDIDINVYVNMIYNLLKTMLI